MGGGREQRSSQRCAAQTASTSKNNFCPAWRCSSFRVCPTCKDLCQRISWPFWGGQNPMVEQRKGMKAEPFPTYPRQFWWPVLASRAFNFAGQAAFAAWSHFHVFWFSAVRFLMNGLDSKCCRSTCFRRSPRVGTDKACSATEPSLLGAEKKARDFSLDGPQVAGACLALAIVLWHWEQHSLVHCPDTGRKPDSKRGRQQGRSRPWEEVAINVAD